MNLTVYPLASANIDQSPPDLVKVNMTNRSRMNLILYLVGAEQLQLHATLFTLLGTTNFRWLKTRPLYIANLSKFTFCHFWFSHIEIQIVSKFQLCSMNSFEDINKRSNVVSQY